MFYLTEAEIFFPPTFVCIQWAFHFDESKHFLRLMLSGEVISTGIYLLSNEQINIAYSAAAAATNLAMLTANVLNSIPLNVLQFHYLHN